MVISKCNAISAPLLTIREQQAVDLGGKFWVNGFVNYCIFGKIIKPHECGF
jgi:hypothetical protein